ncbi:hypothetical protein H7K45_02645 [Mycobacterium yunnanensis]|uniref:Uncharacterized protein n=1 Tax=Mycobacterium yunnanensis TaxID=368477 RepID=A0A9X2YHC8_9MYCO|nr:hypothetical protein [Mycobacterium yunnanensis]MCV7419428.1 hypothetical protein [Mycobacterium yunnanensis]
MTEQKTTYNDDPSAEFLATAGLVTMLGTVVSGVIALVSLGAGHAMSAAILGTVALLSFALSLFLFSVDSKRSEGGALPFPSWLRAEPETAAEVAA